MAKAAPVTIATLSVLRMPGLEPGASVPPLLTVTLPVEPLPPRVPPLPTVVELSSIEPSTNSVPPMILVLPA